MRLFEAISRALRDLVRPRILAVLFLPMLAAIMLWSVLLWMFWDPWRGALRALLDDTAFGAWLATHADWFLSGTTALLLVGMVLPAMFVTAIVLTELIAMPQVVRVVSHSYPRLERRGESSALGSLSNAAKGVLVFFALWIVTLPLWLTGLGALVVPIFNSAYLNQRLFRYDALAEHATRDEYRAIVARLKWPLYGLGVMLAALYYVPFVNLVAPVFSALAFTHFCLRELERMRRST
jgi:CysZ protein